MRGGLNKQTKAKESTNKEYEANWSLPSYFANRAMTDKHTLYHMCHTSMFGDVYAFSLLMASFSGRALFLPGLLEKLSTF